MIVDPTEIDPADTFEDALELARAGSLADWPLPDPVLTALAAVADDPSDEHVAAARAAFESTRAA